jgi:hypothetical protein
MKPKRIQRKRANPVTEWPILFSGEMVRAILEGRKSQTRRVAALADNVRVIDGVAKGFSPGCPEGWVIPCPYGDRLWVRESFRYYLGAPLEVAYEADGGYSDGLGKLRPSIHMPRWASRLTLEITKIRVERVRDISKDDALAEGISVLPLQSADDPSAWFQSSPGVNQERTAQASYRALWDKLNAKREDGKYAWAANPWVWVLEFTRLEPSAERKP